MPRRTLEHAHLILKAFGAEDWIGADEDQLGVSVAEHEAWLRSADATAIRDWACSVATDYLTAESLCHQAISVPLMGDWGVE